MHDPQIVWSGTDKTGQIYRSPDGGLSWTQRDNGARIEYDTLTFRGFTVDPRLSSIVYAMGELTSETLGRSSVWGGGSGSIGKTFKRIVVYALPLDAKIGENLSMIASSFGSTTVAGSRHGGATSRFMIM